MESITFESLSSFGAQGLDIHSPRRIVLGFDRFEKILGTKIRVCALEQRVSLQYRSEEIQSRTARILASAIV